MAETICGLIENGLDLACIDIEMKYLQRGVIINHPSVDPTTVVVKKEAGEHNATFELKTGETGYAVIGDPNMSSFEGVNSFVRVDGRGAWRHVVTLLGGGMTEEALNYMDKASKGLFVILLATPSGKVVAWGLQKGLVLEEGDFTITENGGLPEMIFSTPENDYESAPSYIYVSDPAGQEMEDFLDNFKNPPTP